MRGCHKPAAGSTRQSSAHDTEQAHEVRSLRSPDAQRRSAVARGLCAALCVSLNMDDSIESAVFPEALAAFARRLAGKRVAIYGVAYDMLHFGSWTLEVGRRHRRILLAWDGKESSLGLSVRSVSDSSNVVADWRSVSESQLSVREPAAVLAVAEELVLGQVNT